MHDSDGHATPSRFWLLFLPALLVITAIVTVQEFHAANGEEVPSEEPTARATYVHGILDLTIPYHAARAGAGQLAVEVLDPEDNVLAHVDRPVDAAQGQGEWREGIAPGETVTLHFRLRAKYPVRARTFQSKIYEYYDPEVNSIARPVQLEIRQRSRFHRTSRAIRHKRARPLSKRSNPLYHLHFRESFPVLVLEIASNFYK